MIMKSRKQIKYHRILKTTIDTYLKISDVVHNVETDIFGFRKIIRGDHLNLKSRDLYFKMMYFILVRASIHNTISFQNHVVIIMSLVN